MAIMILAGLLVIPATRAKAPGEEATRHWVVGRLHESLESPLELDTIASMLFGLVNTRDAAEEPDTRRVLGELATRVRSLDVARLGCDKVVNLHAIAGFLAMAGMKAEAVGLGERVQNCLDELNAFDKASALFALCYFGDSVPRERLVRAMDSLEALQLPDGSFGTGYGLPHFYTTTHALFALHACRGDPLAIQLGQDFLGNSLPRLRQAGFIDALLQDLLMLKKMGVEIPEEGRYVAYLRSRIRSDGSICCFDRPGCPSDPHATSLLLEFLREFPVSQGKAAISGGQPAYR